MSIRRLLFFFLTTEVEREAEPLVAGAQLYIMRVVSLLTVICEYESLPQNGSLYATLAFHFARRCGNGDRRADAGRRTGRAAAPGLSHRAHRAARRRRHADGARDPALSQGAEQHDRRPQG